MGMGMNHIFVVHFSLWFAVNTIGRLVHETKHFVAVHDPQFLVPGAFFAGSKKQWVPCESDSEQKAGN